MTDTTHRPIRRMGGWAQEASAIIAMIKDDDLRSRARYLFEEMMEICISEQNMKQNDAEHIGYIYLLQVMNYS